MSKFIDGSKHPQMTAAIEGHFFSSDNKNSVGEASGKGFAPGGTSDWNTASVPEQGGIVNSAPTGAPSGPSMFNDNIASPMLPRSTGVNYKPLNQAGHRITTAPFQGAANGLPGNAPGAGTKLAWD